MSGLATLSVGELITALRDASFFVGILVLGWKARGIIQPAIAFFDDAKKTMDRANEHFEVMESGMSTLLTNHLKHIEADLAKLTGRESVAQEDNSAGE
jgi:hypothetical protein